MKKTRHEIDRIFAEHTLIDEAVKKAAHEARLLHQRLGLNAPEWRDGKVVWVSPWETQDKPAKEK